MFVNTAWVVPAGNQAFRELLFGGPVVRGANEMTLIALASYSPPQFHVRIALAFAPLALGLFSFSVVAWRRGLYGAVAMCATVLAIYSVYYVLFYNALTAPFTGRAPAFVGWLPNLVILALALLLWKMRAAEPEGNR
jgi:lipopolysaccharide export LptBFGC system permease protein LptF